MLKETIIQLIIAYSLQNGVDPVTALAVAKVESNFKPAAVGSIGEVGLFQVRPEYSKYTKAQLRNPHINIQEGIRILKFSRTHCVHKQEKTWLVCYNTGVNAAKRIKHPKLFPYYKKVMAAKKQVSHHTIELITLENYSKYMYVYLQ